MIQVVVAFIFGMIYSILDRIQPNSFRFKSNIDPYYFSFTTMSSVGYGDYTANTEVAKAIVIGQQLMILVMTGYQFTNVFK